MIVTEFNTCLVCGESVLSLSGDEAIPMCSTHSKEDRLIALSKLEKRIAVTREEINGSA